MGRYKALEAADLVLLVGARGPWYPPRRRPTSGKIVAVHDNPLKEQVVYERLHADYYLEGDIAESPTLLIAATKSAKIDAATVSARRQRWTREHENYVSELRAAREKAQNGSAIDPLSLLGALAEVMPADTIYVDETNTHSHRSRQHLPQTTPQSFFRGSGGLGQGIGTALGLKPAGHTRPDALLIGDGPFP